MSTFEKVLKGLAILSKYPGCSIYACHDQILAGPADADMVDSKDEEDLRGLGWVRDGSEGWACFV